jgi:cell division protein FtsQ
MRQVKPRDTGHGRPGRAAGRGGKSSPSRGPQPRPRKRTPHEATHAFDPEGTIERLRESFLFRAPVLTLTAAVVGIAAVAGVLASGFIGKTETKVEQSIQGTLAGMGFAVQQIQLSGNEQTAEEDAYDALNVVPGGSIFAFDPVAARLRLIALPWIADAEVSRRLPDTLSVRLIEKRPFALWRRGTQVAIVERSGAVITKEGTQAFHLPVIAGEGAPEAAAPFIDALASYKTLSPHVQLIERVGARRWDLKLEGGITVRLPELGWEAQLKELAALIEKQKILDREIEIIDLRYPDNLIFRLHNGDSRLRPRQQRA